MSALRSTMHGLLPPSSSVTGVRWRAALAITERPVWPDPVNIRWSKGRALKAGPRPPPSSKNISLSVGKYFGLSDTSRRARWLEFSDILTIARLPAAKIAVSGANERFTGKFHGTMTPTTPSGCGISRLRASG